MFSVLLEKHQHSGREESSGGHSLQGFLRCGPPIMVLPSLGIFRLYPYNLASYCFPELIGSSLHLLLREEKSLGSSHGFGSQTGLCNNGKTLFIFWISTPPFATNVAAKAAQIQFSKELAKSYYAFHGNWSSFVPTPLKKKKKLTLPSVLRPPEHSQHELKPARIRILIQRMQLSITGSSFLIFERPSSSPI